MITLEHVTKRYSPTGPASVDDLSLTVAEGTTVALVGPSGCGKTTTMRMINRLIEPSSGTIRVGGVDVISVDPVELRRGIGYVIQQVGLFSHMTVLENIASVPRLLGWPEARIRGRTEEMLNLVGLDPTSMARRYPRQLSGGQRQRVGVARALAADPPVLLMDEPFGAIDPIARGRLQEEFRQILRKVRKTVVLVTHDLDEAIRLGDRLAIMRDGKLVQFDTPDAILSRPADGFVEDFVGVDRALKRLSLFIVDAAMTDNVAGSDAPRVRPGSNLRDALALMIAAGSDSLIVMDEKGGIRGRLSRDAIFAQSKE